jgi:hypothetical protein
MKGLQREFSDIKNYEDRNLHIIISLILLTNLFHQPAQQYPLKGGKPGNYDCGEKVVKQPPCFEKFRPVNRKQYKRNPMAKTVTTG